MITARVELPVDTQLFFNLPLDPFTPAPRCEAEVFTTRHTDALLKRLEDTVAYQGFVAILGDIGSGKTLLKHRLVERVERSQGRMKILFPQFREMKKVSSAAIVNHILEAYNQKPRRSLVSADTQVTKLLASLNEQGIRLALCFDECHHLNDDTLTALKNFVELGSGGYTRYLGVILLGQNIFKTSRLQDPRFREIAERLTVLEMPAITKQAWEYVSHRLTLAGCEPAKLFEKKAVELLAAQASTPLALGNLCNAALIKAHSYQEPKVLAAFIDRPDDEPRVRSMRKVS